MKGNQPGLAVDGRVQRGDVAVADQRLGITPNELKIEPIEQTHAAVPPAHAHNRIDGWIGEGIVKVLQPLLIGTCEVTLGLFHPRVDTATVATPGKPLAGLLRIQPCRTGRGDDGKAGIAWQCNR
ncbi:hypothetical protein D3C80_1248710 [compost metagenome]